MSIQAMCHHLNIRTTVFSGDRVWRAAAMILLAIVFVADVYRATTQSLTIDEAFSYNLYFSKPVHELLTYYDANNHVLYTVLAKIAIGLFGNAEWVLRLPSLIGALLYLIVVYRLCWLLVPDRLLAFAGVALLSLNPYLLDFLSAARGYGLGIGLMLWGIYWTLRSRTPDSRPSDLLKAGFVFGCAVACNMTVAFAVAGFATIFWLTNRSWRVIDQLGIPMVVSAFVFLAVPLSHATRANFYVGTDTLQGTLASLVMCSFRHHVTPLIAVQSAVLESAALIMALAAVVCLVAIWWGGYAYRVLIATFGLNLAALVGAHVLAGLKYPELRTGLYLIPLVCVIVVAGVSAIPFRVARWVLAVPLVAACVLFAIQWNTSMYTEWQWDQNSRTVAKIIRDRQPHRVGASWPLVEALNYYRDRFHLWNVESLTRADPGGDFDMYVLLPENYDVLQKRGLREIYRDPKSEVVVALPGARSQGLVDNGAPASAR
jgi:4-amino-4-deoxy-L-arabinose transferase-like glycosyltransferase